MCTTKKASSPNPHRRNARERSLGGAHHTWRCAQIGPEERLTAYRPRRPRLGSTPALWCSEARKLGITRKLVTRSNVVSPLSTCTTNFQQTCMSQDSPKCWVHRGMPDCRHYLPRSGQCVLHGRNSWWLQCQVDESLPDYPQGYTMSVCYSGDCSAPV